MASIDRDLRSLCKTFPFLIRECLWGSKGKFRHGTCSTSNVEVDGRLIDSVNSESRPWRGDCDR
jgi:hypothetical protein